MKWAGNSDNKHIKILMSEMEAMLLQKPNKEAGMCIQLSLSIYRVPAVDLWEGCTGVLTSLSSRQQRGA